MNEILHLAEVQKKGSSILSLKLMFRNQIILCRRMCMEHLCLHFVSLLVQPVFSPKRFAYITKVSLLF